jgi:secreted trypsin-like serine protease
MQVSSNYSATPEIQVIGGENASITDAPWQVALISIQYLPTVDHNDYYGQFCGGSIYNNMWIITAAHCVDNNPNVSKLRILAGSAVLSETSLSRTLVDRIVIHPDYNPDTYENDIALIRLKSPLVYSASIQPIFLPSAHPTRGETAMITGWGNQSASEDVYTPDLQKAQVTIGDDSFCLGRYDAYSSDKMMCAFDDPGYNIDTCQGDSGGPLAVINAGRWELHGITSFGRDCAVNTYPGVYAETFYYVDWIQTSTDVSQFKLSPTPTIRGSLTRDSVLEARPGTWSDNATLSYQWLESNQPISGEVSPTLSLTAELVGKRISVAVTGTQQGFATTTKTSSQTAAISGYTQPDPGPQSISGTMRQGQIIQAEVAQWDGEPTLSYVWYRGTRVISGATEPEYTLTTADINQNIKVTVTATRLGYNRLTKTSPLTAKILGVFSNPPTPTYTGTLVVGSTLTARPGTWSPAPTLSYQWLRNGAAISGARSATYRLTNADRDQLISVRVTASRASYVSAEVTSGTNSDPILAPFAKSPTPTIRGSLTRESVLEAITGAWSDSATLSFQWLESNQPISGGTSSTLTLTPELVGKRISVAVTGTQQGFATTTRTSLQTAVITGDTQPSPGTQTIDGRAEQGLRLIAVPTGWDEQATLSYVWYRGTRVITGATSQEYTLTTADVNQNIKVAITGNRVGFNSRTVLSAATPKVLGVFSNSQAPSITGTLVVGSTLTARPGSWSPAPTFSYQWLRNGVAISRATAATYKLTTDDRDQLISVKVTAKRSSYVTMDATSADTVAISIQYARASVPTIRVFENAPLRVGSTLEAITGSWDPGGSEFSYQWLASNAPIEGETSPSILLTPDLHGKRISVQVTGSNLGYLTTRRVSAQSVAVAGLSQDDPGLQSIAGTLEQGETLEAQTANWHDEATLSYVWYRGTKAISGATLQTYTLKAADINQKIKVAVTGSRPGYNRRTITSSATSNVAGVFSNPPTPTISGTVAVGSTLTARPGTWSPAPTFSYQWLRDGEVITGARASSYKLTATDLNTEIKVRVTASRTFYIQVAQESVGTAPVQPGTISSQTPTITGSMVRSGKLTASPGTWSPAPVFTYQWLRNGVEISGATSRNYFLTDSDVRMQIIVRVSASVAGYSPKTTESTPRDNWTKVQSTFGTYSAGEMYSECLDWADESNSSRDWQNVGNTYYPCDYNNGSDVWLYNSGSITCVGSNPGCGDDAAMMIFAGWTELPTDILRYRVSITYRTYESNHFSFFATNLDLDEFTNGFTFGYSSDFRTARSSWINTKVPGDADFVITGLEGNNGSIYLRSIKLEIERWG